MSHAHPCSLSVNADQETNFVPMAGVEPMFHVCALTASDLAPLNFCRSHTKVSGSRRFPHTKSTKYEWLIFVGLVLINLISKSIGIPTSDFSHPSNTYKESEHFFKFPAVKKHPENPLRSQLWLHQTRSHPWNPPSSDWCVDLNCCLRMGDGLGCRKWDYLGL